MRSTRDHLPGLRPSVFIFPGTNGGDRESVHPTYKNLVVGIGLPVTVGHVAGVVGTRSPSLSPARAAGWYSTDLAAPSIPGWVTSSVGGSESGGGCRRGWSLFQAADGYIGPTLVSWTMKAPVTSPSAEWDPTSASAWSSASSPTARAHRLPVATTSRSPGATRMPRGTGTTWRHASSMPRIFMTGDGSVPRLRT